MWLPARSITVKWASMKRARHLLQSSVLVILFFGGGKLTGLLRARLVSNAFGLKPEFDAFTAANQLPEVFFAVIAGGSLAAAFIPVYAQYLAKEDSQSGRLANTILNLVILILGAISAVGAIFAPWLTRVVLVPGFSPEMQALTADLMRIILIQTTIFGVSGVLSSILNAHQHFALPALAPLSLDIGYFAGLYLFVPRLGIHGLAWGTVVGGLLHIAIQAPALIKYRFQYRIDFHLKLAGVAEIVRLMGPRIVTLGTIQLADLFIIRLASDLPTGSAAGYFYGYSLMQLPETLFGTAVALVMFPTMAELFNAGDLAGLKRTAAQALGIIWTLTIPAAALLVLLGEPAIGLLLEGGQFDADATRLVYSVLLVFSWRVVSEATLEIVARLFYARHNTRTPMFAYIGWLVVNVGLAYYFVPILGIIGLALSSAVAFTLLAAALLWLNHRELKGMLTKTLGQTAGRALAATAVMSLAVWGVSWLVDGRFLFLGAGAVVGFIVYLAFNMLLGGQEIPNLIRLIKRSSSPSS